MICQWQSVLNILPLWMRQPVDAFEGKQLQELRLRLGQRPQLCMGGSCQWLEKPVSAEDLRYVINSASRYSPWAVSSLSQGYITVPGGHRVGICGDVVMKQGSCYTVRWVSSVCLRISRDLPGIADRIRNRGNILIVGAPGSGKTTLLRDLIRSRSNAGPGSVCVVDERCEIFPVSQEAFCYSPGARTDVLSACPKREGIETAIRCLSPATVAVDEITAQEDCKALLEAAWCGVELLATAHAGSREELWSRPVYKPILEHKLFSTVVIMNRDKSFCTERMAC